MGPIYALTLGLSAALLFLVQPLWTRLCLPQLGGAPAVWNTAMVFFQAVLLLAYAYAHLLGTRAGPAAIRRVHAATVALALASLVGLGAAPDLSGYGSPTAALLATAALGIGPGFFALATTSPLLQRWYSRARPAADPYALYAASNLGSFVGLFAYPLLEPWVGVSALARLWQAGALLWALLLLRCLAWPWAPPAAAPGHGTPQAPPPAPASPDWRALPWLQWLLLAALPAAASVAVTTWLSAAVASVPLLWAAPLGLYLLSFVVVFAARRPPQAWLARALPLTLTPVALLLALEANHPPALVVPLHLAAFFALCLAAHGKLAELRPPTAQLTGFYLVQSSGGVLGSAAAALLAPALLRGLGEYPLALAIGAGLAMTSAPETQAGPARRARTVALALLPATAALLLSTQGPLARTAGFALAAVAVHALSARAWPYALAWLAVVTAAALQPPAEAGATRWTGRSFFGVHRVADDAASGARQLFHGITAHGRQGLAERDQCRPTLYYHADGPAGQVLGQRPLPAGAAIGAVGLGTGALACYAQPHHGRWVFYEIDRAVEQVARDPQWFTYLRNAQRPIDTVIGDARVSLASAAAGPFDVLVLDAYSADSIPLHLLTREALALYGAKLRPGGILLLHLSNRYFDLAPILAALARDGGWHGLIRDDARLPEAVLQQGRSESRWAVLARTPADLAPLDRDPRWQPLPPPGPLWTDDRASAWHALRWDWLLGQ